MFDLGTRADKGSSFIRPAGNSLACSKRSDSGERCEVKKAMKSRGGLPCFYFFALLFTSHRSPLSERLEQARNSRAERGLIVDGEI